MEIDCLLQCKALCCTSVQMSLSEKEVELLRENGAVLIPVNSRPRKHSKNRRYLLIGECPFLENNQCLIYSESYRPQCCHDLMLGDKACLRLRNVRLNL